MAGQVTHEPTIQREVLCASVHESKEHSREVSHAPRSDTLFIYLKDQRGTFQPEVHPQGTMLASECGSSLGRWAYVRADGVTPVFAGMYSLSS